MRVLITGASGFIGAALTRHLSGQGHQVIASIRHPSDGSFPPQVKIFEGSLSGNQFAHLLQKTRPNYILHCAGTASVPESFIKTEEDYLSNTSLVFEVLSQIKNFSPDTGLLFFSSAAVYGRANSLPINEATPLAPVSPYGFHKQSAELICKEFYEVFGIQSLIARVFSTYGPGLRKQVCWDLSNKIVNATGTLTLQGTGEETRDFIHIDDLCVATEKLISKGDWSCGTYNVASGIETPIKHLAQSLCHAYGCKLDLQFEGQLPEGVPARWVADISRLANLGFDPIVGLEAALRSYTNWARTELSALST